KDNHEVIWKLGGRSGDFTFVNDPYANLCGQHTAYLTGSDTRILIFDNGQYCYPANPARPEGTITRIAEYELDEVNHTATLLHNFGRPGAVTFAAGSSQRLANGNTFVG